MSANDELQAHTCEKVMEEAVSKIETTTLTEQWKKGELEEGYYYTKYNPKVGKPFVEIELRNYLLDLAKVRDADTVEILAPVPSYDDWVYLHKARNDAHEIVESLTQENKQLRKWCEEFNALDVAKENQQLKELLKECREKFVEAENNYGFDDSIVDICDPIIKKIDEVLK